MGCGKSFWGKKIAAALHYQFIDLDKEIEQQENLSIATIFTVKGENYFREIEHQKLLQILRKPLSKTIIATGGGTPCFYNAIDIMNDCGTTIWLNDNITTIAARLQNEKENRPLLQGNCNNIKELLNNILQERKPYYNKCKHIVNHTQINKTTLLNIIEL